MRESSQRKIVPNYDKGATTIQFIHQETYPTTALSELAVGLDKRRTVKERWAKIHTTVSSVSFVAGAVLFVDGIIRRDPVVIAGGLTGLVASGYSGSAAMARFRERDMYKAQLKEISDMSQISNSRPVAVGPLSGRIGRFR